MDIFGFKSFADRSHIEFNKGITALLGPNGCGKSNVVDAIKWVLGEQASRTLRAEKMEDVIFNGTEARKALNVAEVSLTLSNEEGQLELDIPEIEVKRRLYRSGESEYFINSAPVRLKEVRELFYDTGIGKSAYSIMEQGRIDQVLSNKPEERRYIFEEAAGITKFKIRGAEAEKKLLRTEENLRQVEGILGEVKRSHDSLSAQSAKTVQYRTFRKDIFEMEKNLQILKLHSFRQNEAKLKEKVAVLVERRENLRSEIETINKGLESSLDQVNALEQKLVEQQKSLYGLELEQNNLQNQKKMLVERNLQFEQQIQQVNLRVQSLKQKLQELESESTKCEKDIQTLTQSLTELQKNIQEFDQSIQATGQRVQNNEKTIQESEEKIHNLEIQLKEFQNQLSDVTERLVVELESKLKERGIQWNDLSRAGQVIEDNLATLNVTLKGRAEFLGDRVKLSKALESNELATLHKTLVEEASRTQLILTSFYDYKAGFPDFLNEFLSPEGILTQKHILEQKIEASTQAMTELRVLIQSLLTENQELRIKIDEYRATLEELKLAQARGTTQLSGFQESLRRLSRERGEQGVLIADLERDKEDYLKRMTQIGEQIVEMDLRLQTMQIAEKDLKERTGLLKTTIMQQNQGLMGAEKTLQDKKGGLAQIHSELEAQQLDSAQLITEIKNIYDNFRDKHSVDLRDFESESIDPRLQPKELKETLQTRKEELKALGQVNLMAPEEFREVDERYRFLSEQLTDLRKAREDLHKVTKEIQKESSLLFIEAFGEIKKNFHEMFRRLFGGGRAELRLTDPENVLESGIEMLCQPPGKKLENIALLSGGERSLTAVGLLFATYLVKPSPFCILDEIDAALDETNVGRFVNMLMEFGVLSQFIVITHNKKTVAGAGTMIGVTMEDSGVSKIISIRLAGQEV